MLAALFGSSSDRRRRGGQYHPLLSDPEHHPNTSASQPRDRFEPEAEDGYDTPEDSANETEEADEVTNNQESEGDDNEDEESDEQDSNEESSYNGGGLLPIFSTAHLDVLPVFLLTRTIRELVASRCENTLSWDQLRSPQVSQFLLKPIQQEIRADHFNAATEYALMANCLQFEKEAGTNPGNSGACQTRAMVCELLAIRLLKEYSTRELIDALSYDFDPLQGQPEITSDTTGEPRRGMATSRQHSRRSARISCYEVAIRCQAKRFLAHPLVVRQLEAIWAGTIVFHSAADYLHRKPPAGSISNYGAIAASIHKSNPRESHSIVPRRGVSLYNPKDASLFKLSRLRVPRYRNIMSTISFAIFLGLFLAVLIERTLDISTLEVVFWLWAAGYMLDEILNFNEQGFSLYIASFWNIFDLGILLLLFLHLCLRIYGIVMPDVRKHTVANMAYDVLAFAAILLFPRLFSVLDHYRYFSQLLIAFRMMAIDLAAVFVLILISCSGFFVALSLSFGNEGVDSPSDVAYALLQMLMGFTPAAWDRWDKYNRMGQIVLTLFLFICHFLVVTILITVLTNSFMAIVRNAHDEHQFVFAVNTISNVKSDALFSYMPPTNILQWLLNPLRYCIPLRQFVKLNRTIIKCTHFPILFAVFLYERVILRASFVDSLDLVEDRGRLRKSYTPRLPRLARDPSLATMRQDRALEAVFSLPLDTTIKHNQHRDHRKTSNVVSSWMRNVDHELEVPRALRNSDRRTIRRRHNSQLPTLHRSRQDYSMKATSVASNPEVLTSQSAFVPSQRPTPAPSSRTTSHVYALPQDSSFERDEEVLTNGANDGDDDLTSVAQSIPHHSGYETQDKLTSANSYFGNPLPSSPQQAMLSTTISDGVSSDVALVHDLAEPTRRLPVGPRPGRHVRNFSSATMIYNPSVNDVNEARPGSGEGQDASSTRNPLDRPVPGSYTPNSRPTSSTTHRTPKRGGRDGHLSRLRPVLPAKDNTVFRSTPNLAALRMRPPEKRERTTVDMDLVSDIGDNKAIGGGYVGAIPASFAAQMAQAARSHGGNEDREMLGRMMMARMNTLEEGFREIIHEMRETRRQGILLSHNSSQSLPKMGATTVHERKLGRSSGQSTPRSPRLRRYEIEGVDEPDPPLVDQEPDERIVSSVSLRDSPT